jgi:hypothetical protein
LEKSAKQQTSETLKSLNKGGCSLYFNYVKNALDNNSVREFHELQDVDYHSEDEQASDAITTTAINVLGSSRLQADPYVMCGLQDLIPGRHTDVTISDGGKKVNILLTLARKQLMEGSKKMPELMPISSKHTPPYSNFVSNVDNRAWRNELSSEPMYPHQEARNTTAAAAVTAPAEARNMTAAAAVTALAALTADGHNGRKGPKEGTGHILERVFERVFTGDKEDCGKGACTACTQRSCLHVCR